MIDNLRIHKKEIGTDDDPDLSPYIFGKSINFFKVNSSEIIGRLQVLLLEVMKLCLKSLKACTAVPALVGNSLNTIGFDVLDKARKNLNKVNGGAKFAAQADLSVLMSLFHAKKHLQSNTLATFKQTLEAFKTNATKRKKTIAQS